MKIGFLGRGVLAGPAGRRLSLNNIVYSVAGYGDEPWLAEIGADQLVPGLADLARHCDVVVLCFADPAEASATLLSAGGVVDGLSHGKFVIDLGHGLPETAILCASETQRRGADFVEAVLTGHHVVEDISTLSLLVSGSSDACDTAVSVLQWPDSQMFRCGATGTARRLDLLNNMMAMSTLLATLEVVAMGRKFGLTTEVMTEVINMGSGRNRTSQVLLPAISAGASTSNVPVSDMLAIMDMGIGIGWAKGASLFTASTARCLLQAALNDGGHDVTLDGLVPIVESMAGTRFAS